MGQTSLWNAMFLAFAAAGVIRGPDPEVKSNSLVARQDDFGEIPDVDNRDKETGWCQNINMADEEQVRWVWNDWAVGWWMDTEIQIYGRDGEGWLVTMADQAYPGVGDTEAYGCSQREQTCFEGELLDCRQMVDDMNPMQFFIFTAVKNMQNAFETAHENLQDDVIYGGLRIDLIVSDFSAEPKPGADILAFIAAAFTMAAGAAAFAHPGTRMLAGLVSGAASSGSRDAMKTPGMVDATGLQQTLSSAFAVILSELETQLSLAVGGKGDYETLVGQSGDYDTPIAKFFHDGRFLLQGQEDNPFSGPFKYLERSLVDQALTERGYAVLSDSEVDSEESCENENVQGTHGSRWLADVDGGRCFRLYLKDNQGRLDYTWNVAKADIYDKLTDNYNFDLAEYFQATYDCAVKGDGKPDVKDLVEDEILPICFYQLPCQDSKMVTGSLYSHRESFDWPRED